MKDTNPFDRKSMQNAYAFYVKECKSNGKRVLEWKEYRDLCCDFNMEVQERLLEGEEFNMGNRIGSLLIRRVERGPSTKKKIDYHKTKKLGKRVYHDDPFYFFIAWKKTNNVKPLKYKQIYSFDPTTSFSKRMWKELKNKDGEFDKLKMMKYKLFRKQQNDGKT